MFCLFQFLDCITSGASGGLGLETTRALALHGVHVVMAVRNTDAGRNVKEEILKEIPTAKIDVMELDLSSMASIRKFASEYNSSGRPLHILINNAGVMATPFMLSKDNIEMQFATNHLETMKKTTREGNKEGRIVNLSSEAHRFAYTEGIRFDKINDESGWLNTMIFGAGVTHPQPWEDRILSIAANPLLEGFNWVLDNVGEELLFIVKEFLWMSEDVGDLGRNSQETKILVWDKLSVEFDFKDISPEVITYLDKTFANRYKNWKSDLHAYFKEFNDPHTACLEGCPSELEDRPKDWEWLCNHFTDPNFVKSVAGKIARDSKTLLHHSGLKPFSYRLEARRQEGSKFLEIDVFNDVYVRPGNETTEQLHLLWWKRAVLQEATLQLPPETPMEDVTIPEDVGFQIMTEVLDQKYGRRHGKVVWGMGKGRVHETGASFSRSTTGEVNPLKEEVTTLKG
ncbi:uncharacterized protein LOC103967821 [Pyrus x bretschneideri]|uniref:uncharacterized protein LOC103967821 n=1 Tax=Pyrus x bretschneideri TaxID=225117 RepID=UPI00202F28BB|nr:uncharacterized protein LOC103967821 [Pyrus x bretschneideri]